MLSAETLKAREAFQTELTGFCLEVWKTGVALSKLATTAKVCYSLLFPAIFCYSCCCPLNTDSRYIS